MEKLKLKTSLLLLLALLLLLVASCNITVKYDADKLNNLPKPLVVIACPNIDLNKSNNDCMIVKDGQGVYHALPLSNPVNKALYDSYNSGDTIGVFKKSKPVVKASRRPWLPSEYIITQK